METYPTKYQIIGKHGAKEWPKVQRERLRKAQEIGLSSKNNTPFRLVLTPEALSLLSEISEDRGFLSSLKLPKSYVYALSQNALKKEAYYSSRIEGAATSLEAAFRNMSRKKADFSDESMQMIYNNKLALEFMEKHKANDFSERMICELQKILVYNTHKERSITVGNYRKGPIYVVDGQGQVVYEGPPADRARQMMDKFIIWMNRKPSIHTLVDAAIVHLYFVHIHPFDDGNGRSARALSNLYLEKNGYDFINLLSPSDYFEHHKAAYYKSIQAAQDHDYDATYFVSYYLQALKDQLSNVKSELKKESKIIGIKEILDKKSLARLNQRQIKAVRWMLETEESISTRKHCKLNKCSDESARKDFNRLQEMGIIKSSGSGRSRKYILKIGS